MCGVETLNNQEQQWGFKAMQLYLLAISLANKTPNLYSVKGPGLGNHASKEFTEKLRQLAKNMFGSDFSEKKVCKDTKHAFDFYIPEEGSVIEIAFSLHNSLSEYEKDIFKCLLAKEEGLNITSLLFIAKPGAIVRHEAAGSKRIRELVWKHFRVWVDIMEVLPPDAAAKVAVKVQASLASTQRQDKNEISSQTS
jgi:hypothetical protein